MKYLVALLLLTSVAMANEECVASIYSTRDALQPGTKTASGIKLDDAALTAAHKSIKFGTKVTVLNKHNQKSIDVTITDRGPYVSGRCIDLTIAAAKEIECNGLCKVLLFTMDY